MKKVRYTTIPAGGVQSWLVPDVLAVRGFTTAEAALKAAGPGTWRVVALHEPETVPAQKAPTYITESKVTIHPESPAAVLCCDCGAPLAIPQGVVLPKVVDVCCLGCSEKRYQRHADQPFVYPGIAASIRDQVRKVLDDAAKPRPIEFHEDDAKRTREELSRLRKMEADIRGAVIQRRFNEGGSDIPATVEQARHTFRNHTTMELVGWALRKLTAAQKDRNFWKGEHTTVKGTALEWEERAKKWEKEAKEEDTRAFVAEVQAGNAASDLAVYKARFEEEQRVTNGLRALLSTKSRELVAALDAANEAKRVSAALAEQYREAHVGLSKELTEEHTLRKAAEEALDAARRIAREANERAANLQQDRDHWRSKASAVAKVSEPVPSDDVVTSMRILREERDIAREDRNRLSMLCNQIHAALDPNGVHCLPTHDLAVRIRKEFDALYKLRDAVEGLRARAKVHETMERVMADICNDYSARLKSVPAWLRARAARLHDGGPLLFSRRDELENTARAWEEEAVSAPQAQGTVAP